MDQLGRSFPVRDVEYAHVAADDLRELVRACGVRSKGPADAEKVRAQPERVAALDGPGRLDPPERRDAGRTGPALEDGRLSGAVRLAGTERDGPTIRDQQRVEGVDEIRVIGLLLEDVDGRPKPRQDVDERRVFAAREREVACVQETVGRVIERPPEGRAGRLDEHIAERSGHALRPKRLGRDHGRRIAARKRAEYAGGRWPPMP